MKYTSILLCSLLVAGLPRAAAAGELQVSRTGVIQPEAELAATVAEIKALAAKGGKKSMRRLETFFAPRVKSFSRGLDPFGDWYVRDDLTQDFLEGVADVMVEKGELPDGGTQPDYRIDAMRVLANHVLADGTFGTMTEMPGAVCAPAVYKVDRKAALAFARKFELDAYSLRFYADDIVLVRKPEGKKGTVVPAKTLIMFDHDPKAPDNWGYYETAGGTKGYMRDRDDTLGLSQNHVCFAKVKGKYRIVGIFGYGF